jgi:hypothetical protein
MSGKCPGDIREITIGPLAEVTPPSRLRHVAFHPLHKFHPINLLTDTIPSSNGGSNGIILTEILLTSSPKSLLPFVFVSSLRN